MSPPRSPSLHRRMSVRSHTARLLVDIVREGIEDVEISIRGTVRMKASPNNPDSPLVETLSSISRKSCAVPGNLVRTVISPHF